MSYKHCQRCFRRHVDSWEIKQAEFHVGDIENWKVQMCPDCTAIVEQAVLAALQVPASPTGDVQP